MKRTLYLGHDRMMGHVFAWIELRQDDRAKHPTLSISGVIAPNSRGDASEVGQVRPDLERFDRWGKGWSIDLAREFIEVWDRWHLNTMRAGSPRQEAFLREHPRGPATGNWYEWALKTLEEAGLNPDDEFVPGLDTVPPHLADKPYRYGTAWLEEQLPDEIVRFVTNLPNGGRRLPEAWESR